MRTLPQNALYHAVYVKTLAEYFGEFHEDMHESLKKKFNPKSDPLNPLENIGGTTTKLTRKEFSKYLEDIKLWAMITYQIDLPESDEKAE